MLGRLATVAGFFLAVSAQAAIMVTVTSGTYDEQTVQLNTVDHDTFSDSAGTNTVTHVSLATFKTDVSTAFTNNTGGVINFDDVTNNTSWDSISATYGASHASTLNITPDGVVDVGYQIAFIAAVGTPISGANYLRDVPPGGGTNPTQTFNFSIGLSELGYTVLARNASRDVTATLTYSDASTGVFGPYTVVTNTGSGDTSSPDTFFGFAAPSGLTITQLVISAPTSEFFAIDDLAFVAVPEPSIFAMALGGFGILIGLQRIRSRRSRFSV